jgi:branched-subunit amino acid aminotransferase/4-amino-4-deoxychorismate lyase
VTQNSDLLETLYPIGYVDGRGVRVEGMGVPLHGPSAQYAITLFEGLIGYPLDGGIGIVALGEHFRRLHMAAATSRLGFERDPERLQRLIVEGMEALPELLRTNNVTGTVYIRPTLYHQGTGNVCLGPALEGDIHLGIYLQKWDGYLAAKPEGQRVVLSDYVKASSPVAHLKCSANYGLAIPAKREAKRKGFDEVIFLDERGLLAEASSQNMIVDVWDTLVTPIGIRKDGNPAPILPGITLKILTETIAPDLGLQIVSRPLSSKWIFQSRPEAPEVECRGVALCGTASEVRHVGAISKSVVRQASDERRFERPSERLQALMDGYAELTRGEAYREWLTVTPL